MHSFQKIYLLQFLLILLNIFFPKSISQETTESERYIDSIRNIHSCSEQNSSICYDHIPVHVPNPCDECKKPDGNCGAGLRCVCHPKECKDKVISVGAVLKPWCNIVFSPLIFLILKDYLPAF
ncbi:uncharacterized protein LOC111391339 [Olea europaea subsp. europaea]|uniref:Uncharacterized protein LOC111391339 n=1 Tax=Olea europaea subsp. europaea TaxID=158383 RepID=A0A8S0QGW2_OLEEU|nr:uncharacterized protein LOC111391339 [Olea europaea subsp. europaea]